MTVKSLLSLMMLVTLTLACKLASADFEADLSNAGNLNNMQALRELHARAVAGDAEAQLNMGGVFFKGQEVEQDYTEGEKWFRMAARQGNAQAQFNLGMMYATGQGVAQDHAEAVRWYRLAAGQGLALAQLNLGVAYATGQGVTQDETEAAQWIRLAADRGEAQAQFNLAVMYANGQGVAQNLDEACRWAKRSADQGHQIAPALLKDLNSRMKPEQLAGATPPDGPVAGQYYLQLAAFKSQQEADNYVARMRSKLGNIDKPFSIFTSDGWIRTQIGPYYSREAAHRGALSLKTWLGYEPLLKQH